MATYLLPGPTILSTRGIVAGAVGERGDRVRAADAKQPGDARLERRRHDDRLGPRADGDDLGHARDARRHGRHQQRGGQRKPPAGHVAADARDRFDALLDRHTGTRLPSPNVGESAGTRRGRCSRPPAGWRAGPRGRRGRPVPASLPACTSSGGSTPSNLRAKRISARSPSARTRSTMARTRRVERAVSASTAGEQPRDSPLVAGVDDSKRHQAPASPCEGATPRYDTRGRNRAVRGAGTS